MSPARRRADGFIPATIFHHADHATRHALQETRGELRTLIGEPAVRALDALAAVYLGVWQGADEVPGADLAAARAWLRRASRAAELLDRLATGYEDLPDSARDRVHEGFARARRRTPSPMELRQARDLLEGASTALNALAPPAARLALTGRPAKRSRRRFVQDVARLLREHGTAADTKPTGVLSHVLELLLPAIGEPVEDLRPLVEDAVKHVAPATG